MNADVTTPRPLPRLDDDNRFFWTSGADGLLRFVQCRECGKFIHPPRPLCPRCRSEHVEPTPVAGTGVVDSYTVNYQKFNPAVEVPFIIARVAIDGTDGVILTTNIVGCPIDAVAMGDRVSVEFEQHGDIFVPLFHKTL